MGGGSGSCEGGVGRKSGGSCVWGWVCVAAVSAARRLAVAGRLKRGGGGLRWRCPCPRQPSRDPQEEGAAASGPAADCSAALAPASAAAAAAGRKQRRRQHRPRAGCALPPPQHARASRAGWLPEPVNRTRGLQTRAVCFRKASADGPGRRARRPPPPGRRVRSHSQSLPVPPTQTPSSPPFPLPHLLAASGPISVASGLPASLLVGRCSDSRHC